MTRLRRLIRNTPIIGAAAQAVRARLPQRAIKGRNNSLELHGERRRVTFDVIGDNNVVRFAKGSRVFNTLVRIRGNNHRVVVEEGCFIGGGELWLEDSDCSLLIHAGTTIESAHLAVTERGSILEIDEDCMLAHDVEIRTGDSHAIFDRTTGERVNPAANVRLMRHVWVGAHARILKGVTVADNAIVATCAVLSSDVPANSIAAGAPAKVIRTNVEWTRER